MSFLYHISANSHTCGSDAITFVGSLSSSEVTLIICHILGLLGFWLPKIGGGGGFVKICKNLSFDKFQVFSVSKVISCFLMAFLADLKRRQQPSCSGNIFEKFQVFDALNLIEDNANPLPGT